MTTTQVAYVQYVEQKRHNIASENLTAKQLQESVRHNKVGEKISAYSAKEQKRHNIVSEKQENFKLKEQQRHNLAGESLTATQIAEQIRHNKATESLTAQQLTEMNRHNVVYEGFEGRKVASTEKTQSSQRVQLDAKALWDRVHSVTEFANALSKAKLPIGSQIYLVEELLVNPDISRESKEQLMKFVNKLYHLQGQAAITNTSSKKNKYKYGTANYNVQQKFIHH